MELHLDITGDDKVVSKVLEKMMGSATETQESTTEGHVTQTATQETHETLKVTTEEPKPKRHPGRPKKNAADDEDETLRDKIFG